MVHLPSEVSLSVKAEAEPAEAEPYVNKCDKKLVVKNVKRTVCLANDLPGFLLG